MSVRNCCDRCEVELTSTTRPQPVRVKVGNETLALQFDYGYDRGRDYLDPADICRNCLLEIATLT